MDPNTLDTVARLRRDAERQAAEALQRARETLERETARLEMLSSCMAEYENHPLPPQARLRQVVERQRFCVQLGEALQAQRQVVDRARCQVEAARAQWLGVRLQREALDRLLASRLSTREQQRSRSEQRTQDERACAASFRPK